MNEGRIMSRYKWAVDLDPLTAMKTLSNSQIGEFVNTRKKILINVRDTTKYLFLSITETRFQYKHLSPNLPVLLIEKVDSVVHL